jgi:type I restriction enzyme M protein
MLASKRHRPWTLSSRDKVSLEISWIPDESLEDSASLPDLDEIAAEIVEDVRAALAEFEAIQEELSPTQSG